MDSILASAIARSLPDGAFTTDLAGRVTWWNPVAERLTGLSPEEVLGRQWRAALGTRAAALVVTETPLLGDGGLPAGTLHLIRGTRPGPVPGPAQFVTRSPRTLDLLRILPDVAASGATVLVEGPSGSGKELLARAIHAGSPRAAGPFVAVNCAALPDALLEAELFGARAGAYTDARRDRAGRFATAQGGTIFLDEIGDVSPAVQPKLLRVLQEKEYQPLGSDRTMKADVRVIAATNRDLRAMMVEGTFREDLYWRLAIVRLSIPPLRERKEDILLLADHFIAMLNAERGRAVQGLTPAATDALLRHDWPGNVRELRNAIEHAMVMCRSSLIDVHCLPPHITPGGPAGRETDPRMLPDAFAAAEADVLRRALAAHGGHRGRTAAALGIHRVTLIRKMKRLGLRGDGM